MKLTKLRGQRGLTLVELVTASVLLGVLMLTAVAVELSMRNLTLTPNEKNILQAKVTSLMNLIEKDWCSQAIGTFLNVAYYEDASASAHGFAVRVDSDRSGTPTPDDMWHGFAHKIGGSGEHEFQVYYYYCLSGSDLATWPNPTTPDRELVGDSVTIFNYHWHGNDTPPVNNALSVGIEACKDPTQPYDPLTNPCASINETFFSHQISNY